MTQRQLKLPRDIPSDVTPAEVAKLAELSLGGTVLELGALFGFSTIVMAQAARRVTSVDWHQGDEHQGTADSWDTYRANLERYEVAGKVDARRGRFEDVLPALAASGAMFDGVFIDGQHDAASVARDLGLAMGVLKPGGWVAFHDYGRGEATGHPGFGVTEVADRFGVTGTVGHLAWGRLPGPLPPPVGPETRILGVVGLPVAPDGSGYYRIYLPFKHLQLNSRHLYDRPDPGVKTPPPTPEFVSDLDVLVMQRPAFAQGMRQFDKLAGHVARVYETDDDMISTDSTNIPEFAADPRSAESVKYCLARAEMVTVSTPYLADLYGQYSSNIRVLPNYVKANLLDLPRRRPPDGRVTVGWQGGVSHLADVCAVQDPLRQVLDANPQVGMHWMGVDYSPLVRRECRYTPWRADVGDFQRLVDFDIAIAPLAATPFNRAKSHLKALEAAARGIPIVAQDMEPYREFVRHGETGYLVRTDEEWVAALTGLIHDEAAREEMGAKAKEVAAQWTIEGNWQLWEAAYESCAS